jgi:tetratricopeptide repeat protein 30
MQRTSYQMVPATAAPGAGGAAAMRRIPEGQYTATIYTYIRDGKFTEVIRLLSQELLEFPKSRAALSLLGYSYYSIQDFASAAQWLALLLLLSYFTLLYFTLLYFTLLYFTLFSLCCSYESLVKLFPEVDEYRLYHSQCLFKSGQYVEATKSAHLIENTQYAQRVSGHIFFSSFT